MNATATKTEPTALLTVRWRDSYSAEHVERVSVPKSWLTQYSKDGLKTVVALKLGRLSTITLISANGIQYQYRSDW